LNGNVAPSQVLARLRPNHGASLRSKASSTALLLAAAFFAVSQECFAQSSGVEDVTQAQPSVNPREFHGDLSALKTSPLSLGSPKIHRQRLPGPPQTKFGSAPQTSALTPQAIAAPLASMPATSQNFAGLSSGDACDGGQCGSGWPPDPNGDVGPNHFVEAVNDAVAIYDKTGALLASFTEDQLWSGAGTPCDGNSQGDPIVVYDWLADRFVLSWFAFGVDAMGNGVSPYYQCIAASKTSDPVSGGWWLYPIRMDPGTAGAPPAGDLNDYVKVALWHDCLYLSANEFDAAGNYDGVAFGSISRADLYSGAALTYSLGYLPPSTNAFTMMPSNNQGKGANAAQPGTPNYFVSESGTVFAFEVRAFTAGPNCGAGGTLSSPVNVSQATYTFRQGAVVPQPNTSIRLDMIDDRIMQKAQYRRIGGAESLWVTHPVGAGSQRSGKIAMQWAQIDVTGGTITTTPVQQQIYAPDSVLYRFMGSLAVDIQGNMALGYSTSNGTAPNFPSIAYSGRLATDPPNTLPQSEMQIIAGSGSQMNNCGGAPCDRWGDYSAMSLDPADSCTFWYVNEYYASQANGTKGNWQTRIASFKFPSCGALPPTTTTIASSLNPSNPGDSVTFTATVTGSSPTGSVDFLDSGSSIGGCAAVLLGGGTAQCTTSTLASGTHSIVAKYSGDGSNAASQSGVLWQVVNGGGAVSANVALASAGAVAAASSTFSANFPVSAVNNGDRAGLNFGAGGVWQDATNGVFPDWVQINFAGSPTIDHVIVYSVQDNDLAPVDPSDTLTFTKRGLTAFDVQTWNGSAWVTQGSVTGNNLVKRTVSFGPIATARIRVLINGAAGSARRGGLYSYVAEIEAWTPGSAPPPPTGTTISSSLNPVMVNQGVTFTATVNGTNPTGTVTVTSNGSPIAGCTSLGLSGAGNSKTALCTTAFAATGTYNVVASYSGDGNNAASASSPLSEAVRKPR
jgi:hypothetical protein